MDGDDALARGGEAVAQVVGGFELGVRRGREIAETDGLEIGVGRLVRLGFTGPGHWLGRGDLPVAAGGGRESGGKQERETRAPPQRDPHPERIQRLVRAKRLEAGDEPDAGDEEAAAYGAQGRGWVSGEADEAELIEQDGDEDGSGEGEAGEEAGAEAVREGEAGDGGDEADEAADPGPPRDACHGGATGDGVAGGEKGEEDGGEAGAVDDQGGPGRGVELLVEFGVGAGLEGVGGAGEKGDQGNEPVHSGEVSGVGGRSYPQYETRAGGDAIECAGV